MPQPELAYRSHITRYTFKRFLQRTYYIDEIFTKTSLITIYNINDIKNSWITSKLLYKWFFHLSCLAVLIYTCLYMYIFQEFWSRSLASGHKYNCDHPSVVYRAPSLLNSAIWAPSFLNGRSDYHNFDRSASHDMWLKQAEIKILIQLVSQ